MKKYRPILVFLNLIMLLGFVNYSIFEKEALLEEGRLVLLRLAPVDPRSLMQGDYMELRYDMHEIERDETLPKKGYCILKKDTLNIFKIVRLQEKPQPLKSDEVLLKYASGKRGVSLGAESYFFEEGTADVYDEAKFGGLKIDKEGNSLLFGLFNNDYLLLEPKNKENL